MQQSLSAPALVASKQATACDHLIKFACVSHYLALKATLLSRLTGISVALQAYKSADSGYRRAVKADRVGDGSV